MLTLEVPAANGNGAAQLLPYPWGTIDVYGTFDSGTVTIYVSPDAGTTWYALKDTVGNTVALAANGYANFERATKCQIRATLSGSSGGTSLTCTIKPGFAPTLRDQYGA